MTHHGQLYQRDQVPPRSTYYDQGKFGSPRLNYPS